MGMRWGGEWVGESEGRGLTGGVTGATQELNPSSDFGLSVCQSIVD